MHVLIGATGLFAGLLVIYYVNVLMKGDKQ
jgi:hypothetical protein